MIFSVLKGTLLVMKTVAAQHIVTISVSQICNTHALDANLFGSRPRKSCKGNVTVQSVAVTLVMIPLNE